MATYALPTYITILSVAVVLFVMNKDLFRMWRRNAII